MLGTSGYSEFASGLVSRDDPLAETVLYPQSDT